MCSKSQPGQASTQANLKEYEEVKEKDLRQGDRQGSSQPGNEATRQPGLGSQASTQSGHGGPVGDSTSTCDTGQPFDLGRRGNQSHAKHACIIGRAGPVFGRSTDCDQQRGTGVLAPLLNHRGPVLRLPGLQGFCGCGIGRGLFRTRSTRNPASCATSAQATQIHIVYIIHDSYY